MLIVYFMLGNVVFEQRLQLQYLCHFAGGEVAAYFLNEPFSLSGYSLSSSAYSASVKKTFSYLPNGLCGTPLTSIVWFSIRLLIIKLLGDDFPTIIRSLFRPLVRQFSRLMRGGFPSIIGSEM